MSDVDPLGDDLLDDDLPDEILAETFACYDTLEALDLSPEVRAVFKAHTRWIVAMTAKHNGLVEAVRDMQRNVNILINIQIANDVLADAEEGQETVVEGPESDVWPSDME